MEIRITFMNHLYRTGRSAQLANLVYPLELASGGHCDRRPPSTAGFSENSIETSFSGN